MSGAPLLRIRGLVVDFSVRGRRVRAVDGLDLEVRRGEALGLVGESGSGKTVTVLAALGLLPRQPACTVTGSAELDGRDLLTMSRAELRDVRGRRIGMVFQDPMTSLHPSLRIVDQVAEALLVHDSRLSSADARRRSLDLLERVGIAHPGRRAFDYPHQWSGGMRQRAMVAMAMANRPELLVADEPTTALDVTVQAQVLDVLRTARTEAGAAAIVITHDLGVVAELADRVAVVQAGRVVEEGSVSDVFRAPRHPHTAALLAGVPRLDTPLPPRPAKRGAAVLQVEGVTATYRGAAGTALRAVDGVDLLVREGETLGLVGESGCGKTTLARTVLRLVDPDTGTVLLTGDDLTALRGRRLIAARRSVSMVFQDPYSSLNPRVAVGEAVAQPLRIAGRYRSDGGADRVARLLDVVGLEPELASRLPAELSGGQRQRVGIARALALSPRLVVLDEPVSSLDVSVAAQVVGLLERLQAELGLSYLFISHDLSLVRRLSDRVAVMHLGRIVETGHREQVYTDPLHPYTQSLLSAVPRPDPEGRAERRRIVLSGEVPDPAHPPSGCRFRTRCWRAREECAAEDPALVVRDVGDHPSACLFPGRVR